MKSSFCEKSSFWKSGLFQKLVFTTSGANALFHKAIYWLWVPVYIGRDTVSPSYGFDPVWVFTHTGNSFE
jgi:hypothetical protein